MPRDAWSSFRSLKLDRNSRAPVYLQIAEGIGALLRSGAFPSGYLLPPGRVFCKHYGVSRMTLRQAFGLLEREGLIEARAGHGTFVSPHRFRKQQQEFRSFTEDVELRGGKPRSRVISFEVAAPSVEARELFQLTPGQHVYRLVRVRLDNGTPLSIERVELPQAVCPGLERFDFEKNSLYQILEEVYGLRLESSIDEIRAELPSPADRKLLGISAKTAVLAVRRKTFTEQGQALELSHSFIRGDTYTAVVHSVRGKPPAPASLPPADTF